MFSAALSSTASLLPSGAGRVPESTRNSARYVGMRFVIAAAILCVAVPAHAMGSYIDFTVVAWSRDGKSALVEREATSSGMEGGRLDYIVITAGREPLVFTTQATKDYDQPHVDTARQVRRLERVEKARGLYDRLATKVRAATGAERAAIDRAGHTAQDEDSFVTVNGELVLELFSRNGDESGPAHLVAWSRRGARYVASEDLRY